MTLAGIGRTVNAGGVSTPPDGIYENLVSGISVSLQSSWLRIGRGDDVRNYPTGQSSGKEGMLLKIDQAFEERLYDCSVPVVSAQFMKDLFEVEFDGALGNAKNHRNVPGALSGGAPCQDFSLPVS